VCSVWPVLSGVVWCAASISRRKGYYCKYFPLFRMESGVRVTGQGKAGPGLWPHHVHCIAIFDRRGEAKVIRGLGMWVAVAEGRMDET